MIGRTLAHYSILEKLGEGGMGAVYKALDTRLERPVALKILPAGQVSDPDRRRRFAQEAKAASALNHPNIVTIHDIGEDDGVYYIAMEYVAGRSLDDLIGGKGMPLKEALGLAIQIADGLGKAHAAGIVHRDLKPSNIMVTSEGLVKILDFGLAKLVESPVPAADPAVTMTAPRRPATEEGVILGTVSYMSPEQAAGKPVDARSDIFSFGSVLYEMLTGRRAFEGETKVSTLAAVIATDPAPPRTSHGPLPQEVERVVMRALRKDPQRRWQTMTDLKIALQDLKDDSESGRLTAAAPAPSRPPRRTWLAAGLVGLAVLAAGGIVAWLVLKPRPAGPGAVQPERITFEPGFTFWPAFSTDGTMIAYSVDLDGNFDLYVRQLNGRRSIRRTEHPAPDWLANFSPDGSKIVFRSEREGGGLYLMESLAGPEHRIADEGTLPVFSPDGSTIAYLVSDPMTRFARLFVIPAPGGPPRPLAPGFLAVPRGASWSPPLWSADGKTVLFDGMKEGERANRAWWLVPLDGSPPVAIKPPAEPNFVRIICAWSNGGIYYAEGSTIGGMTMFRVPLSAGPHPEAGRPELVTAPAGMLWGASISAGGRMVFSTMSPSINVWAVPLSLEATASGPPEHVTSDPLGKMGIAASADGSRLAWLAYSTTGLFELRVREIRSGREDAVPVSGKTLSLLPCLSPDGSRLAYSDIVDGRRVNFMAEKGAAPQRWPGQGLVLGFFSGTRDVFAAAGDAAFRLDTGGNRLQVILDTSKRGDLREAALSPMDGLVAFTVHRADGVMSLYAAPVRADGPSGPETWMELEAGRHYIGSPSWSRDGRILYYGSNRDDFFCVWARRFGADGRPAGGPFAAFHDHRFPDMNMYRISFLAAAPGRLYMLLSEFTGDLWSLALPR